MLRCPVRLSRFPRPRVVATVSTVRCDDASFHALLEFVLWLYESNASIFFWIFFSRRWRVLRPSTAFASDVGGNAPLASSYLVMAISLQCQCQLVVQPFPHPSFLRTTASCCDVLALSRQQARVVAWMTTGVQLVST